MRDAAALAVSLSHCIRVVTTCIYVVVKGLGITDVYYIPLELERTAPLAIRVLSTHFGPPKPTLYCVQGPEGHPSPSGG